MPHPGCHHDSRSETRSSARIMPDNGMVERVIRTLKEQCLHRQRFDSIRTQTGPPATGSVYMTNAALIRPEPNAPHPRHLDQRPNMSRLSWVNTGGQSFLW